MSNPIPEAGSYVLSLMTPREIDLLIIIGGYTVFKWIIWLLSVQNNYSIELLGACP